MLRPHGLHPGYERLIGSALLDGRVAQALLADPVNTARALGLPEADAARLAGIRAGDLTSFARALVRQTYGLEDVWEERRLPSAG
jgi:hypothetical protein